MSNGAILDDLGALFRVKPGDDMFSPRKTFPGEMLALAEVCDL